MYSFNKIACQNTQNLPRQTLIGMFSQNQKVLDFLEKSEWEIISYNHVNRQICISVKNKTGTTMISLTAPALF